MFGWGGKSAKPAPKTAEPAKPDAKDDVIILQPGPYKFDIVGEASYQSNLEAIAGGRTEDGADLYFMALLSPEPNNPHDANAVRVLIEKQTVGYLSKTFAAEYRKIFNTTAAVCYAQIRGGWYRPNKNDAGHFGVKLAICWPPKRATFG